MEKEQDYTFVTIDDNIYSDMSESFIIDVEDESMADAVVLDESLGGDLITLSDDTVFMTDADVIDLSSLDTDDWAEGMNGMDADNSFMA